MTTATITQIAKALGISGEAVRKRARINGWKPTGETGVRKYAIDNLPLKADEKRKLRKLDNAVIRLAGRYQYEIDQLEDQKRDIECKIKSLKRQLKAKTS